MILELKTQVYNLLTNLGYKATDNGVYRDDFPWLMVRTNGYQRAESIDTRVDVITITIDIFSTYNGEKEVLEIIENIGDHIQELKQINDAIMYINQTNVKVMDDNKTGPVRKHGLVSYQFLLSSLLEVEPNE